jgi:hypothetical protein
LLAHGRWFSPGTPASSTTKTRRRDIAESGIKHNKSIKPSRHIPQDIFVMEIGRESFFSEIIYTLNPALTQ